MISQAQIDTRLHRVSALTDVAMTSTAPTDSLMLRGMLVQMLRTVWELCRDIDPQILIQAGTATTPPNRR